MNSCCDTVCVFSRLSTMSEWLQAAKTLIMESFAQLIILIVLGLASIHTEHTPTSHLVWPKLEHLSLYFLEMIYLVVDELAQMHQNGIVF